MNRGETTVNENKEEKLFTEENFQLVKDVIDIPDDKYDQLIKNLLIDTLSRVVYVQKSINRLYKFVGWIFILVFSTFFTIAINGILKLFL